MFFVSNNTTCLDVGLSPNADEALTLYIQVICSSTLTACIEMQQPHSQLLIDLEEWFREAN